jgi:hypothetical protein
MLMNKKVPFHLMYEEEEHLPTLLYSIDIDL